MQDVGTAYSKNNNIETSDIVGF